MSKSNSAPQILLMIIFILSVVLPKIIPPIISWLIVHDTILGLILSVLGIIGAMLFTYNCAKFSYLTDFAKLGRSLDASRRARQQTGRTYNGGWQTVTVNEEYFRLEGKAIKKNRESYQLEYRILLFLGLTVIVFCTVFLIKYNKWLYLMVTLVAGSIIGGRIYSTSYEKMRIHIEDDMKSLKRFKEEKEKMNAVFASLSEREHKGFTNYFNKLNDEERLKIVELLDTMSKEQGIAFLKKLSDKF